MDDLALARALHVLAVVIWIGGVAMVTIVVLPAVRRGDLGPNRLQAFEAIERRFSWHARIATLIVGLTGLYMIDRADLWDRFRFAEFWWMHAMVAIWLVFSVLLFVAEPLDPAPPLRPLGDGSAGRGVRLAAAVALGPARVEPRDDFRRGRGESRMVDLLGPRHGDALVRSMANRASA